MQKGPSALDYTNNNNILSIKSQSTFYINNYYYKNYKLLKTYESLTS